jgi:hypothetical protein
MTTVPGWLKPVIGCEATVFSVLIASVGVLIASRRLLVGSRQSANRIWPAAERIRQPAD